MNDPKPPERPILKDGAALVYRFAATPGELDFDRLVKDIDETIAAVRRGDI